MNTARDIIARALGGPVVGADLANEILIALAFEGWRLVPPGAYDDVTKEAAALAADEEDDVVLAVEAIRALTPSETGGTTNG